MPDVTAPAQIVVRDAETRVMPAAQVAALAAESGPRPNPNPPLFAAYTHQGGLLPWIALSYSRYPRPSCIIGGVLGLLVAGLIGLLAAHYRNERTTEPIVTAAHQHQPNSP